MKDLEKLSTHDMGYVFEHLIRKFYEDANATAGEHFTPREVIHLMVNLLIAPDRDTISGEGQVINILDPACGTGGMLTAAEDKIKSFNPNARVYLWGQELNPQSWATCGSEMLLRDQPGSIFYGNSFSNDGYAVTPMTAPDQVRLHAGQPAVRRRVEDRQAGHRRREGRPRLRGPVRGRAATDQRRVVPVPAAHDLQDGAGRGQGVPPRDRLQRVAAVHRRGGLRRVEHPEVDPGERLAGRDRRAAGPALLQHRDLHVLLDPHQPEGPGPGGQGHPARRPRPVGEDAQVPRRQAQADQRRPDRAHHDGVRGSPRPSPPIRSIRTTGG